jgi:hypothetical protein
MDEKLKIVSQRYNRLPTSFFLIDPQVLLTKEREEKEI